MHYQEERNFGCRVSDSWMYRGLKTVVMENELIRIVILADKGADIYQFVYKKTDTDFKIYGDGSPIRDYMYVDDLNNIFKSLLDNYKSSEPVIISTGEYISIKNLVDIIVEKMEFKGNVVWGNEKNMGQIKKVSSNNKLINFDKDIYLVDLKELEKKYRELEHTFNPMEFSLKFGGKLNPCEQKIIKKFISWDKSNSPQINKQSSYLILIENIEREHHKIINNFVDFFNQLTSRKNKEIK